MFEPLLGILQMLDPRQRRLIVIAHRLRTVRQCDVIFELADGRVVASGTYHDLMQASERFRQMVGSVS